MQVKMELLDVLLACIISSIVTHTTLLVLYAHQLLCCLLYTVCLIINARQRRVATPNFVGRLKVVRGKWQGTVRTCTVKFAPNEAQRKHIQRMRTNTSFIYSMYTVCTLTRLFHNVEEDGLLELQTAEDPVLSL